MTALDLIAQGKPKTLTFVSTTAVFEAPAHYVTLSDSLVSKGGKGILETDDLEGSRYHLGTGYAQTKWVCEKLLFEAGKRGLRGGIIRPSYVVGDSSSAVTNTDDFLWRLVKGCIQLGYSPDIYNKFNMVPVDHIATIIKLATTNTPTGAIPVYNVTARPTIRFNDFLASLPRHGYAVEKIEYLVWRRKLEQHVLTTQDNALFPLLHYVLEDLPTSTKGPELDDSNTAALLRSGQEKEATTVDKQLMARYLAWLVATGFLEAPASSAGSEPLPTIDFAGTRHIGRSGK